MYYFGEDVDKYENGVIVSNEGSWLAGEGENQPGVFMPAQPNVGDVFEQERAPGIAEDTSEIIATNVTITVPAGTFTGCIKTEDFDPLADATENKWYCPGVHLVREEAPAEDEVSELVSYAAAPAATPTAAAPTVAPTVAPAPTATVASGIVAPSTGSGSGNGGTLAMMAAAGHIGSTPDGRNVCDGCTLGEARAARLTATGDRRAQRRTSSRTPPGSRCGFRRRDSASDCNRKSSGDGRKASRQRARAAALRSAPCQSPPLEDEVDGIPYLQYVERPDKHESYDDPGDDVAGGHGLYCASINGFASVSLSRSAVRRGVRAQRSTVVTAVLTVGHDSPSCLIPGPLCSLIGRPAG